MRILFSSHVFAPSIGGLQSVSATLAAEFVRQGHEVQLVTRTPAAAAGASGAGDNSRGYRVWRRPSPAQLLSLLRWSEVCFHNNISLPRAWPLLLVRRPWVVAHHVWIPHHGLAGRLKRLALRFATGISISAAIAADVDAASTVIPNPYDDSLFRLLPGAARTRDLVFLGRLVSDKGADRLLTAASQLAARGLLPSVTIVGSGPEEFRLRRQCQSLGLESTVRFAGAQHGEALVRFLNDHRIIVIPSLWDEPFGVVALEGMACGCVPVGSVGGGLRDAIGACGETFPNDDVQALTDILEGLLRDPQRVESLRRGAAAHLQRHTRAAIAAQYLRVLAASLTDAGGVRHADRGARHV